MADVILTLKQIEDLFQDVTMQMLGYAKVDAYGVAINQDKVRIAWQTSGAPSWGIAENVTFIRVSPVDDFFARQRDVGYSDADNENAKRSVNYTRVFAIAWTCYGPNSNENIETIRNSIFLPTFKSQFKQSNMYLVTDVGMPTRLPELYNGQWWERSDLVVRYNEGVERSNTVPYLDRINIETRINKASTPVSPYITGRIV